MHVSNTDLSIVDESIRSHVTNGIIDYSAGYFLLNQGKQALVHYTVQVDFDKWNNSVYSEEMKSRRDSH